MKNVKSGHAKPIVCLDAGHYGKYNRSPAVKAYYESDMVWKLHLLLKKELESYGIQVKQTRTNQEKDKDLYSRGKASNGCDLFLSIHSNAVGSGVNESVDYPVVYVQLDGKGHELGKKLATAIEETMGTKQTGCIATRKGKRGEYYGVLRGAAAVGTMGMILEHSFHTNTRATWWLMEDSNLAKMAKVEAGIIADWFGVKKADGEPEPEHWYRIRKSWADASSQKAAYKNLEMAKKNCPEGYTVYDWNGKAVYSKAKTPVKVEYADSFDEAKIGTYTVDSSDGTLNLRAGADSSKALIETLKNGAKVNCYGYYTKKWLLVKTTSGKTGFCHGGYLVKQK